MIKSYENKDFNFPVSISIKGYEGKPANIWAIYYGEQQPTIYGLAVYINNGHCFCGLFHHQGEILKASERKTENFIASYFIGIDCDDMNVSLIDFVSALPIPPTIAYNTPRNGKDGLYRYRLIYVLSRPTTTEKEHNEKYNGLLYELGINEMIKDNCGGQCSRYFNGSKDSDPIINYTVLDTDTIPNRYTETTTKPKTKQKTVTTATDERLGNKPNYIYKNGGAGFLNDFYKMSNSDFLKAYAPIYGSWKRETELQFNENGIAYLPDDYKAIEIYFTRDEQGKAKPLKVQQGHRDKCLYSQAILIRLINPFITLEGLIYALWEMVTAYYDNSDKELTKKLIHKKAEQILSIPADELTHSYKAKQMFKVSTEYAEQTGISKQKLAADERTRQHDKQISLYFDGLKTDKDNLKVLKENGVKVTDNYLKAYRERTNQRLKDLRVKKITELKQQGLTDKEIYKSLGISEKTFYNLKKEPVKNGYQDNNNRIIYDYMLGRQNLQVTESKFDPLDFDNSFDTMTAEQVATATNINNDLFSVATYL